MLTLCAAGACLSHVWKNGPLTTHTAGVALIVPFIAAILFLTISLAVPDLYAVGTLRFPLNFTLPLIYVSSLLLTLALVTRVGLSITKPPEQLVTLNIWANWWMLGATLIAGVLCLTVLGLLERDRKER